MPLRLEGSCRCGSVRFALDSHTPQPYQLCYCSICRKTAGGGGFAINIMGVAASLQVEGRGAMEVYRAAMPTAQGTMAESEGRRHFCRHCATALWLADERWPDLVHPFASVIDTALPAAVSRTHIMLADKPDWVVAAIGPDDLTFAGYPEQSIEDWHRAHDVFVP